MAHVCKINKSRVVNSRSTNGVIRRRRECLDCGKRVSTFELTTDEVYKLAHARTFADRMGTIESAIDNFLMSV